jgi:NitT/TauT family transport system substrate-binding protein
MRSIRRGATRGLLVLAAVLLAGACGDDESDVSADTQNTEAAESEGNGAPEDSGPVSVTILYSRAAEQLSLWVAEDQGFFDDHGVDATLEEIAGASQVPVAISGGSAEMGFETAPDFLGAIDQGIELSVISGLSVDTVDNPRVALIAGKDTGITEPADVEGKRIGVPSFNSSSDLSTIHLLKDQGVDTDSINWVEVPFQQMADAINGGRVDAVVAVHPFIGQLKGQGHVPVLDTYASPDQSMLVVFLSADREWAEEHPEAVADIRAALDDADEFVDDPSNEARVREIMQKYSGLPAEVIERIPFPNLDTEVTPEQLSFFVDVMTDQDLLSGDIDVESLIFQP